MSVLQATSNFVEWNQCAGRELSVEENFDLELDQGLNHSREERLVRELDMEYKRFGLLINVW